jgi:hypothetical protein
VVDERHELTRKQKQCCLKNDVEVSGRHLHQRQGSRLETSTENLKHLESTIPMRRQAGKLAQSFAAYPSSSRASSRRAFQIQAAPSSTNPSLDPEPISSSHLSSTNSLSTVTPTGTTPDARFEVLGSTSSLLSVSLTASQPLYTRRGTLVSVSGNPENAISTLSPLSPLQRLPLGIPFLYQKVTSTTPIDLLVATKAPHTSFAVVHLDGRVDWQVAQRNGVVAWTGHTLSVSATVNAQMVRHARDVNCWRGC